MLRNLFTKLKGVFKVEERKIAGLIEYEEKWLTRIGYPVVTKVIGPIVRWLWIHKVEGLHNIPKEGPVIVASNHESYFDFICFMAVCPRKIHYLAAEKFFESRLWRPLMHLTGQIKVDRKNDDKSEVHQLVHSALQQGRMIGIFPEGTRSQDGKLLKAYTGVAKFALKTKAPIVPVGMIGTYEIMSRHDKFPKFRKARIKIGEPMHFHEYYDIDHTDHHFRLITDKIMLKIAELIGEEYFHAERSNKIKPTFPL